MLPRKRQRITKFSGAGAAQLDHPRADHKYVIAHRRRVAATLEPFNRLFVVFSGIHRHIYVASEGSRRSRRPKTQRGCVTVTHANATECVRGSRRTTQPGRTYPSPPDVRQRVNQNVRTLDIFPRDAQPHLPQTRRIRSTTTQAEPRPQIKCGAKQGPPTKS